VDLVTQLARDVPGGTTITNRVTVDSDETPASTASTAVVTGDDPLQLTKRVKSGAVEDPKVRGRLLVNPGADITYEICITNPSATRTVTNVSLVDVLPPQTMFLLAERDRELGTYDALTHTYTWRYDSLAPGAGDCLDLVVHVSERTEPNTVITNTVTVSARQTQSTTTTVEVVVPDEPVTPEGIVVGDMFVKPTKLYRDLLMQPTNLMVVVRMPEGCGRGMIVNQPAILQPGDIPALLQRIVGTTTRGEVMAFFDPQALLAATTDNGRLQLTMTGLLTDGQSYQGQQDIMIYESSR